jgi:hypothetical protein
MKLEMIELSMIEKERVRILQNNQIQLFSKDFGLYDFLPVYYSSVLENQEDFGIYCCLVPQKYKDIILSDTDWLLTNEKGIPNVFKINNRPKYLRFGNDENIEPLVIDRTFHEIKPAITEISEEFRLFHNLYYDEKKQSYLKINENGDEDVIIDFKENNIKIRLHEIRQYIAIKKMYFVLQVDSKIYSRYNLDELGIEDDTKEEKNETAHYSVSYGSAERLGFGNNIKSYSYLCGKRIILPLPRTKSGIWGFENNKKQYVDYLINISKEGENIYHSCNPGKLSNNFGANKGVPNYLTPVYFKKEVLEKYYNRPSKYSVDASFLRCGNLWGIQIDNDQSDKVCVWLGDLGRDLPYDEQVYWKSYNIPPSGGISKSYFNSQILAQWSNPDRLDHQFRKNYFDLLNISYKKLGWYIILPLSSDDEYHLKTIKIPANDEQKEFDNFILSLTKLLVDSINEKELNKHLSVSDSVKYNGSINKLERLLEISQVDDNINIISFLRKLQNLRSSGAAHRKGDNYEKIIDEFGFQEKTYTDIIMAILYKSNIFLLFIKDLIEKNIIRK